jgi:hypothetical protein
LLSTIAYLTPFLPEPALPEAIPEPVNATIFSVAAGLGMMFLFKRMIEWFNRKESGLGDPAEITLGVRYYNRRNQLPDYTELLHRANQKILILATSARFKPVENQNEFVKIINKGIKVQFLLLNPENNDAVRISEQATKGDNLRDHIIATEKELCNLIKTGKILIPDNLEIGRYNTYIGYSLIIIDPDDEWNGLVQVEFYDVESTANWRSQIILRRDGSPKFSEYLAAYSMIEEKADLIDCTTWYP